MAEDIEVSNLVTKLSIDDTGVNKTMSELARQMQVVQSEFQAASSRLGEHTDAQDALTTKAESLNKQLEIQAQRIAKLKKQHDEAIASKGADARETQNLEIRLNKAVAQYNKLDSELKSTTEALNKQTSAWEKATAAMDAAAKKIESIGTKMTEAGQSLLFTVTAPIAGVGTAATKASIDFESAFAGVRKTVDATEEEFQQFSREIRDMAKHIPQSATAIAEVAEAAGQLGIKNEAIMGFTRTMSDLGVATNMASEQAATALARLANITQMPQENFDRLGATIVDLGNNLATTESEIVEMALRLAGAGHQIGLTEAQILAFAGSLSSVGIEAEAGGSAFSRVMINMAQAVMMGGKDLENFAAVAGVTASQLKETFQRDASSAIIAFVEGLGRISAAGENTFGVLDKLGLSEIRVRDALLRASGAGDLFRNSLELGTKAWEENTALTNEANQRYETTASQLKMLGNRIVDAAITLGDALVPALMSALDSLEPLFSSIEAGAEWFAKLDPEMQRTIITIAAMAAAAGPLLITIGKLVTSIGALIPVVKALGSALMFLTTTPFGLILTAVAGIVAAFFAIKNSMDEAKRATEELAEAQEALQEVQKNGITREEIDATQEKIDKLNELIDTYQRLTDIAAESDSAKLDNNVGALNYAAKELGVKLEEVTAAAKEFGVTLKFIDDSGKISAESLKDLQNAVQIYTNAIKEAKKETASEINEKAKQIAARQQEARNIESLLKTYKSAKQGSTEWLAAQKELVRLFPQFANATGVNKEAIEGLLLVKQKEIDAEWASIQVKAQNAIVETQSAIKRQEAAIKIAESINKITGSSGLAEAALARMNSELDRLRGEAASLQALLDMKPSDFKFDPITVPKINLDDDKKKKSTAYKNEALDAAYRELEHKKRLNQLTLEDELKTLEAIKAKHIKTTEERMSIDEKIFAVKAEMMDKALDKALHTLEREKQLGKMSENDEIVRLERIKKLYADTAEERLRLDDMIFEATQRKIEAEKQLRLEAAEQTKQELQAEYEDKLAREKLNAEDSYKLRDRLLKDQIQINKNYLQETLEDDRYTAAEKRDIERQVTEEIRKQTNERLILQREYNEEVRKSQIDAINNLSKGIQDALKAKYQAEKNAEEERIRGLLDANEKWKREQLDIIKSTYDERIKEAERAAAAEIAAIESVLNAQIKAIQDELAALEEAEKQKSRAELDAEDQKKIDRLTAKMEYTPDEFNRIQLQKEINKILADQEKRHQKEQLEDKKDALRAEEKNLREKLKEETDLIKQQLAEKKEMMQADRDAEIARINEIAEHQKTNLNNMLAATQEHYNQLLTAKALQAEAEKMIVDNQQKEILQLLEGYGDAYNITGQTLGEKMYQGFREKVMKIQSLIDDINRQIDAARSAAVEALNSASAAATGGNQTINNNNSRSVTVNNTFNVPVASPSAVSRATQKTSQRLAGF